MIHFRHIVEVRAILTTALVAHLLPRCFNDVSRSHFDSLDILSHSRLSGQHRQ